MESGMKRLSLAIGLCVAAGAVAHLFPACGPTKPVQVDPAPAPAPPAPPTPPPVTCDDGSPVGTVKDLGCPTGQVGEHKQVCTATGYKDATNTCAVPPPPACGKTQFADVQPILAGSCETCHATISTYPVAQSWGSEIARRVGLPTGNNDHMPQGTSPQLTQDQIAKLQKWVSDGSVQDCQAAQKPTYYDLNYLNGVMSRDALALSPADRPFTRYLIVAHAINAGVTDLAVWHQAVDKALNGLNDLSQDVFKAQAVDAAGGVLRIDLRDYAIGAAEIALIENGDNLINLVDQTSQGLVLQALLGTQKPWFHADNFIDVTYRNSAVYYGVLNIPKTLAQLQRNIGSEFQNNLAALNLNFIGSASSPIAEQKNRLIVRDVLSRSQDAYYWQTFDVNATPHPVKVGNAVEDSKNLFQFPLLLNAGAAVSTAAQAVFTADASEVIFSLPNGLQAYVLFDAAGNLLNAADPNVVIDTQTPLGNKVINAGNSCGRCHQAGTIPMNDQILAHVTANADQFQANDVQLVKKLYQAALADGALFKKDNRVFAGALAKIGVDPLKPDPMSIVTDRFLQAWDLKQAAAFVFLTPPQFVDCVNASPTAKGQIGPLLAGGQVPFATFAGTLQQLKADCRLFQDPLGN